MNAKKMSIIKKNFDVIKLINEISKSYWILNLLKGVFSSLIQFLMIYFSGRVLIWMEKGEPYDSLLKKVLCYVLLLFIFTMIVLLLEKVILVKKRYIEDCTKIKVAEKSMKLDYSVLEKQSTMQMLERASRGVYANGGITELYADYTNLIQYVCQVIWALIGVSGLFYIVSNNSKDLIVRVFNSPILAVLIILLALINVIVSYKITEQLSAIRTKMFEDCVESNRRFGYFYGFMFRYSFGKDIRIYNMQSLIKKEMNDCNKEIHTIEAEGVRSAVANTNKNIILSSVVELLTYLLVGIKAVIGLISIGLVVQYVGMIKLFMNSISRILEVFVWTKIRLEYIYNYIEFLNLEESSNTITEHSDEKNEKESLISFNEVQFSYPNCDDLTLKGINFDVYKGEKIAVVGCNGAGKSTMIKLLCGLYRPKSGSILFKGQNITDIPYNDYLKNIAVVFQDFQLLSFQLGENVACAREVDEKLFWDCMTRAGIDDRFQKEAKGMHTYLYNDIDNGVEVSGGEAQKIALARALYKKTEVLLLDEPTSALDAVAESSFYEKVNENTKDKTVIFISHRMSSCTFCDRIIVLDGGKVTEIGTHQDLLKQKGTYYSLWTAQAQHYE